MKDSIMNKNIKNMTSWKRVGLTLGLGLLLNGPQGALAQDIAASEAGDPISMGDELLAQSGVDDESIQADQIEGAHPYKLEKEKDPFKPLIEKPKPILIDREKQIRPPTPTPTPGPTTPPVVPLKLAVQGIVGNESERLAMILYENQFYVLKKDQDVKGKFKVVDILTDKVVIYSILEQLRRTFPIGGGKE
jgi:hypothetical protein